MKGTAHGILLALASLALGIPTGSAHGATPAPEQYVRFLSDCSDDWGGHSAARDGHDLVALDLMERWVHEWTEPGLFVLLTVGFGFADVGSRGGPLRDEVTLNLAGRVIRSGVTTANNQDYQPIREAGFQAPDVLLPARPSLLADGTRDGTRTLLEYGFRFSTLQIVVGQKITSVFVQAWAASDRGDFMPGGYYLADQPSSGECPPSGHQGQGDPGTRYVRPDYRLRGTEAPFFSVAIGTDRITSRGNQSSVFPVSIKNHFYKTAQDLSVQAEPPPGWTVGIDPESAVRAQAQENRSWEITVVPHARPANGTLLLVVESPPGGRGTRTLPLTWAPLAGSPSPERPDEASPAAPAMLVLALWVVAAAQRRSR